MSAPHTVLGVTPNANPEEIRTAWRALVRRMHPDVAGSSATVEERMKSINVAYEAMLAALASSQSAPKRPKWEDMTPKPRRAGTKTATSARRVKPRGAAASARQKPHARQTSSNTPKAERPFEAPHRMVPSEAMQMRMQAALIGRLRQALDLETARLGGAAYSVPGHPGWKSQDDIAARGGLPERCLVNRIDFVGRTLRLRLDKRPAAGRVLVAMPHLLQDGANSIRQEDRVSVLEIAIPEDAGATLALREEDIARCVSNSSRISVEFQLPEAS